MVPGHPDLPRGADLPDRGQGGVLRQSPTHGQRTGPLQQHPHIPRCHVLQPKRIQVSYKISGSKIDLSQNLFLDLTLNIENAKIFMVCLRFSLPPPLLFHLHGILVIHF